VTLSDGYRAVSRCAPAAAGVAGTQLPQGLPIAASVASPATAAVTRGDLAVACTCQLADGSGAHTFGHVPLLAALSTHVAIVCSGLKSGLIG
jgi:hypothetical protein